MCGVSSMPCAMADRASGRTPHLEGQVAQMRVALLHLCDRIDLRERRRAMSFKSLVRRVVRTSFFRASREPNRDEPRRPTRCRARAAGKGEGRDEGGAGHTAVCSVQAVRRQCAGSVQAVCRRCAGSAQAVRRQCAGSAQAVRRQCAGSEGGLARASRASCGVLQVYRKLGGHHTPSIPQSRPRAHRRRHSRLSQTSTVRMDQTAWTRPSPTAPSRPSSVRSVFTRSPPSPPV